MRAEDERPAGTVIFLFTDTDGTAERRAVLEGQPVLELRDLE
jgi:hypothetical protein